MVYVEDIIAGVLYIILGIICIIGLVYCSFVRHFFVQRVHQLRCALLGALLLVSVIRAFQMIVQVFLHDLDSRYSPMHMTTVILFCLGFWIFYIAKTVLVMTWIQASRRTRQLPRHHTAARVALALIAIALAIPFIYAIGLYYFHAGLADSIISGVVVAFSCLGAMGFLLGGGGLYVQLKRTQCIAPSKSVRQAQRVAGVMAMISFLSFLARAIINILFLASPGIYYGYAVDQDMSFFLRVAPYLFSEILPGFALVLYLILVSMRQTMAIRRKHTQKQQFQPIMETEVSVLPYQKFEDKC